ncbi:MAG: MFS transporter [bacterium]
MDLSGIKTTFRAFRYRNYKIYFSGQVVSLVGSWMQQIALGWLVYKLTNSAFLLGLVGFSGQIPSFILAPFAGIVADRYDRYKVLIATQILFMLQALTLAALVLTGVAGVTTIIVMSLIQGTIMAFDSPVRHAFVIQIVEKKEDLGNAIALNSSSFHASRLVGPPLAGLIIAAASEGVCFLINGIGYTAVIVALLKIKVKPLKQHKGNTSPLKDIKDGFSYAFNSIPIKTILATVAFASVVGMPYAVLMPVMARDVLEGTSQTFGVLMGGAGLGAFTGALYLASQSSAAGLLKNMFLAFILFGFGMVGFSMSRDVGLSFVLLVTVGFGMMTIMASSNTIIQSVVSEEMRGRVMSLYTFSFMGLAPFGNLLSGAIAQKIGTPATIFLSGALCVGASLIFMSKSRKIEQSVTEAYENN